METPEHGQREFDLDVIDPESAAPTGQVVPYDVAHREGFPAGRPDHRQDADRVSG